MKNSLDALSLFLVSHMWIFFFLLFSIYSLLFFCQTGFLFFSNKFSHSALMLLQLCLFYTHMPWVYSWAKKAHTRRWGLYRAVDYLLLMRIYIFLLHSSHSMNFNLIFLLSNYRELYSRVLECVLQTESPELILSNKDEILETLNIVANDAGTFLLYIHSSLNKLFIEEKSCCHIRVNAMRESN